METEALRAKIFNKENSYDNERCCGIRTGSLRFATGLFKELGKIEIQRSNKALTEST